MTLGELDLIFDEENETMNQKTWFKEFITSKSNQEIENKFTTLGNNLVKQKSIADIKNNFSGKVFDNFNLSTKLKKLFF